MSWMDSQSGLPVALARDWRSREGGWGGAIYTRILATTVLGLMEGADRGSRGMNGRMSEI